MSTEKGNTRRTRPQKYKNQFAFKNNLHDKSHKTKAINNLQIVNVCERCKKILEWKIKYKKYKPLKAPGKCNKCEQKCITHSYHTICGPCAKERNVCPKCGEEKELIEGEPCKEEQLRCDSELQNILKTLPERKRRTFIRYMNKQAKENTQVNVASNDHEVDEDKSNNKIIKNEQLSPTNHEQLLKKLKLLAVEEDEDIDNSFSDSDFSVDDSNCTE